MERMTMAMTDAVIERPLTLVEKLENYRDTQTDFEATLADAVIDVCIDIVERHNDWVCADERLPEHNKPVLAWVVSKAGNAYAFKPYYESSWHLDFGKVTHWRELPQPPSEVQDD